MLSQSHSVNTSIESCTTHFCNNRNRSRNQEKNAQCEQALTGR